MARGYDGSRQPATKFPHLQKKLDKQQAEKNALAPRLLKGVNVFRGSKPPTGGKTP